MTAAMEVCQNKQCVYLHSFDVNSACMINSIRLGIIRQLPIKMQEMRFMLRIKQLALSFALQLHPPTYESWQVVREMGAGFCVAQPHTDKE